MRYCCRQVPLALGSELHCTHHGHPLVVELQRPEPNQRVAEHTAATEYSATGHDLRETSSTQSLTFEPSELRGHAANLPLRVEAETAPIEKHCSGSSRTHELDLSYYRLIATAASALLVVHLGSVMVPALATNH